MPARTGIVALLLAFLTGACASSGGSSSAAREARLNEAKVRGAELVASGDYGAAIDVLTPLSMDASGDAQVFLLLGEAHEGAGEEAEAIRSYEQAMRLSYTIPEPHLKLATLLMRQDRIGRALTEFELAIEYGDRDAMVHYNYGLALHRMGRGTEALEHWRRARDLAREEPVFAEAVGIGLTAQDPAAAIEAFHDAETLGARGAAFENNYGLALEKTGAWADAQQRFRAAVDDAPGEESYRFNLAALLTRREDYDEAAAQWEDMIAEFGEHWSYRVYLARCRLETHRFEEAIAAMEKMAADLESGAIARDDAVVDRMPPGLDEAFAVLALAHRGLGADDRSLEYIRRAVALEPRNPSHLNNYGVILAENGMLDEAKAQWSKVLEIDPKNATARENLSAFGR